jgi:hypothetical protein
MVCFRNIIVGTLHEGDTYDDDDDNNNNNNNNNRRYHNHHHYHLFCQGQYFQIKELYFGIE